jgi:hypothetical protein
MRNKRRRYQTAEMMERHVDVYFARCEEREKIPTMTGLALHLGFRSLTSLYRYEGYDDQDFQWVIDTARLRIMNALEENSRGGAFEIFKLKNFDRDFWKDKTEQEVTNNAELMSERERTKRLEGLVEAARGRMKEKVINALPGEAEHVDDWDL